MGARSDDLDVRRCEELARLGARGDAASQRELVRTLWPSLVRLVSASRTLAGLGRSEDHVHEVVGRVVEKLARSDARALEQYVLWQERHDGKTVLDWVRIVASNLVRDYVREQAREPVVSEGLSAARLLNEFSVSPALDRIGVRPPLTDAQTARELLDFARGELEPAAFRALRLWIDGASFEDVACELGQGDAEACRRMIRAAVAVLRRKFAP